MGSNLPLILATGTSGTIGRHLEPHIFSLDLDLATDFQLGTFEKGISWNLIHLAGVVGSEAVREQFDYSYQVNVNGAIRLAKQAIQNNVNNFIYISTSHVYSPSIDKLSEAAEISPINIYAEQKLITENKLLKMFENQTSNLVIVRVFSILDWGMPSFTLGGAIEKLIFEHKGPLKFAKDIRDFLTPKQVADALSQIASNSQIQSGIYNLCTGLGTTIGSAATKMGELADRSIDKSLFEENNSMIPSIIGENKKIKLLIPNFNYNWSPEILKI